MMSSYLIRLEIQGKFTGPLNIGPCDLQKELSEDNGVRLMAACLSQLQSKLTYQYEHMGLSDLQKI